MTIGAITNELSLSDSVLAHCELSIDPTYPFLSHTDREMYVERSLCVGQQSAMEYVGRKPSEVARFLGVRTVLLDAPLEIDGERIRAEYDAADRTISICRTSMAEVQSLLDSIDSRTCPSLPDRAWQLELRVEAVEMHIAHELFHHLEATQIGRVDERLPRVSVFRLGNFTLGWRRVGRCREIAAHKFAREWIGLPFLPNAIDWVLPWWRDEGHTAWTRALQT